MKKMLALLLALALCMVPAMAWAAGGAEIATEADLIAAFTNGGEYKLTADIDAGSFTGAKYTIPVGVTVTLDLNGHTLEGYGSDENVATSLIVNNGTLTVKDTAGGGKISMDDVSVRKYAYAVAHLTICNCGTLNLYGGTLESLGGCDCSYTIDNNSTLRTVTLNIYGGSVTSNRLAIRQFANSTINGNNLNIVDGYIYGAASGVWTQQSNSHGQKASVSISGGTIEGKNTAYYADLNNSAMAGAVTIEISGGTFMNDSETRGTVGVVSTTGSSLTYADINLSISGGTFHNSNENGYALMDAEYQGGDKLNGDKVSITGGTFSDDLSGLAEDLDIPAEPDVDPVKPTTKHTVTAVPCDDAHGSVTGAGQYVHKSEATLKATPAESYVFDKWVDEEGQTVSEDAEYTFTVEADVALTAEFVKEMHTVEAEPCDDAHGSVTGAGEYECGSEATVTATPAEGYTFDKWVDASGATVSTDAEYTFTVEADVALTAEFAEVPVNPTPGPSATPVPGVGPATGDDFGSNLWIAVMVMAAIGMAVVGMKRRSDARK